MQAEADVVRNHENAYVGNTVKARPHTDIWKT